MDYDLAIIGAGWAGFNAAIRAKELGLKVALIERGQIGGTCLNHGCIPTKTLIQSAKVYALTKKTKQFGVDINSHQINFVEVQSRKDRIVQQLLRGMESMTGGIDFINTGANFLSADTLMAGAKEIKAKFILIASGSKPIELNNIKFDGKKIISSDEILNLKEIPNSLLIIGGGVIGCEFAGLFSTLGSRVTIIEKMGQLIPNEDKEVAKKIEVIFKKRGIIVKTNTDASGQNLSDYDLVLLCIGRAPNFEGLGLDKIGIKLEKSKIFVDEYLKTSIPNIYAAGDCTSQIMLAHFAAYQGVIAASNISACNSPKKADNLNIPNCIFTDPEIASVGLNEELAKNKNIDIMINKFDFLGSAMARILDENEGFIKIISNKKTEELLGASIIGPRATELIGILTLAVSSRIKISQIRDTIFAHPTLSEGISEALRRNYAV